MKRFDIWMYGAIDEDDVFLGSVSANAGTVANMNTAARMKQIILFFIYKSPFSNYIRLQK